MNKRLIIIGVLAVAVITIVFVGIKNKGISAPKLGNRQASSLITQAKAHLEKAELQEARKAYQQLIIDFPSSNELDNWQKEIEALNIRLLFSNIVTPNSTLYEIRPGDTLSKIAKDFNTTIELIMKSNNIPSDKINPGRKIKVWIKPFSLAVDKSQNVLLLKCNEEVFKTYIVSTGANNSTPVGTFKIINKLTDPTWFKAGAVVPAESPENILGTRWMGIDVPGYGIHGTTMPQELGKQVTQGCVRMSNAEVEELYAILPVGTEVIIVD